MTNVRSLADSVNRFIATGDWKNWAIAVLVISLYFTLRPAIFPAKQGQADEADRQLSCSFNFTDKVNPIAGSVYIPTEDEIVSPCSASEMNHYLYVWTNGRHRGFEDGIKTADGEWERAQSQACSTCRSLTSATSDALNDIRGYREFQCERYLDEVGGAQNAGAYKAANSLIRGYRTQCP